MTNKKNKVMKLIDKDALVAELKRRKNFHHKRGNQHDSCVEDVLYGILSYIDTLEVKEVDSNDTFIEKACAYLDSIGHRYIIDAFRKYMEGE